MLPNIDLTDILSDDKRCGLCNRERGVEVKLDATKVYDPSQCAYVNAWECPECGWKGYRGDPPETIEP